MPEILIVCAIDDNNSVIGSYAVDSQIRDLPGIEYNRLIDYPSEPQPTGEYVDVLENPDDPESPLISIPLLGWPDLTWSHDPINGWIKNRL